MADSLPETFLSSRKSTANCKLNVRPAFLTVSEIFQINALEAVRFRNRRRRRLLVPALPALDEFPIAVWERLRASPREKGAHLLQYASGRGDADLRKAIAAICAILEAPVVIRPDHRHGRNAAGDDDQRVGAGKSW